MTQTQTLVPASKPDIELHLPETRIDNPSVPLRWCLSPTMHERIVNGLREGYGYALLFVARLEHDFAAYFEVREIKNPLTPFTFFTFPKPGKWGVECYLFERTLIDNEEKTTSALERTMTSHFLAQRRKQPGYENWLPAFADIQYLLIGGNVHSRGVMIAKNRIFVDLPSAGIFAPEPSPAVKAFGNYFFREAPRDQCAFRRRLAVMLFGVFPLLIWESIKRIGHFLVGILLGLFAVKGFTRTLRHALTPAVRHHFDVDIDFDKNGDPAFIRPFVWWSNPGALAIWAGIGAVVYRLGRWVVEAIPVIWEWLLTHHWALYVVFGIIAAATIVGTVVWTVSSLRKRPYTKEQRARRIEKENQKQRKRQARIRARSEVDAALATRHAAALVCGDAPQAVTLEAIPSELQTFGMRFASLKRSLCRPFG